MTKTDETQVPNATDSSVSDTPQDSPTNVADETVQEPRTDEQQELSASYWQSESDKQKNMNLELQKENEKYKYLDVLNTQLETDKSFQKDLAGQYSLMNDGDPKAMDTSYDPDEYISAGQVGKMVKDGVEKALAPMLNGLNILAETNKAKELGINASQADIQRAMNTPMSATERLHYEQLRNTANAAKADGVEQVVSQIKNAQSNSPSIASTRQTITDPPEPDKTPTELKDDRIMAQMRKLDGDRLDITF